MTMMNEQSLAFSFRYVPTCRLYLGTNVHTCYYLGKVVYMPLVHVLVLVPTQRNDLARCCRRPSRPSRISHGLLWTHVGCAGVGWDENGMGWDGLDTVPGMYCFLGLGASGGGGG